MNNNSGKVLSIFLVIIAVLLITLLAVCLFFWNQEIDKRKDAEQALSTTGTQMTMLEEDLEAAKKEKFILEDKNKEADERINNLLDELELEKGLREETKLESQELKEKLDEAMNDKKRFQTKMSSLEEKIGDLEDKLKVEMTRNEELSKRNQELENLRTELKTQVVAPVINTDPANVSMEDRVDVNVAMDPMSAPSDWDNTSTTSETNKEGRVLSVDEETEFVVINLGDKDGIARGAQLSVYRGDEYLGDIRVTRVQPEMSAADLIPPFSSRTVRKNDQVLTK